MGTAPFHIVLLTPEIPNNTGTIGRTAAATGCVLHLIHPLGFDLTEKARRRAGLDYWDLIECREHASWEAFLEAEAPKRLWAMTVHAQSLLWDASLQEGDYLLFGCESAGLPESVQEDVQNRWGAASRRRLPVEVPARSLNLACAVTAVVYEGLRQASKGA